MKNVRGSVPHFTLRPSPILMVVFGLVLVSGLLGALSFYSQEDGTGEYARKGLLILLITGVVSFCLGIIATSKMWFPHLWRNNSSHKRHSRHTHHHPAIQEREFRSQKR